MSMTIPTAYGRNAQRGTAKKNVTSALKGYTQKGKKMKAGFCHYHKYSLTVHQMKLHGCLCKHGAWCKRFEPNLEHEWWKKRIEKGRSLEQIESFIKKGKDNEKSSMDNSNNRSS